MNSPQQIEFYAVFVRHAVTRWKRGFFSVEEVDKFFQRIRSFDTHPVAIYSIEFKDNTQTESIISRYLHESHWSPTEFKKEVIRVCNDQYKEITHDIIYFR